MTPVPVLMGCWIRGRIPSEAYPLSRALIVLYRPALAAVLRQIRRTTLVLPRFWSCWPRCGRLSRLGGEFLPPLDEGDLLYMPVALPGLSAGEAQHLLQLTDRMIRRVPRWSASSARSAAPTPPPIPLPWK